MNQKRLWLISIGIFFIILTNFTISTAKTIDFSPEYVDADGIRHKETSLNIILFPKYHVTETENNYTISRMGDSVILPKKSWISYDFYPDRIVPIVTINNYSQINQLVTKDNATSWYLTIPWSASKVKSVTDDIIDMGVFIRTISISVRDSNTTCGLETISCQKLSVFHKVIGGNIRFYFNPQTFSDVVYPLIITENTVIVNNSSTSGFTVNVSLNGSRYTGSGQLAINLNASYLNGLVGYWSMDETTGTTVHNVNTESGIINTTNQGIWSGNTTINYSTGKIGTAISFDGVNDYITINHSSSFNNSNESTIEAWIYPIADFVGYASHPLSKYYNTSTDPNFVMYYYGTTSGTNRQIKFYGKPGGTWGAISANYTLDLNRWYHIVLSYNSTIGGQLYIDGVATGALTGSGALILNSWPVKIGGSTTDDFINGTLDEVKIWNRALSAAEIAEEYNRSLRVKAMPIITNQTATSGYVINRTRIVYTGHNSLNNESIYIRQNGSSDCILVQQNATSGIWYDSIFSNHIDYCIDMQGNASNTTFLSQIEYDETLALIYMGTNLHNNITSYGVQNYSRFVNTSNDTATGLTIIPSLGLVNISVSTYITSGNYSKVITVNSTNAATTTQHIFSAGSFPANTYIDIQRDGVDYFTILSNSAGAATWTYSGGYSTAHTFTFTLGEELNSWEVATEETGTTALDLWISIGRLLVLVVIGLIVSFMFVLVRGLQTGTLENSFKTLEGIGIGIIALIIIYGVIQIVGSLMAQI